MKNPLYQLPAIEFIGGETETIEWNLWSIGPEDPPTKDTPFDATGCTVTFSLTYATNKSETPLVSKACTLASDSSGFMSRASVSLEPSDTVGLNGKFIYQLTIVNQDGEVEIPGQGYFFININIDKSLVGS